MTETKPLSLAAAEAAEREAHRKVVAIRAQMKSAEAQWLAEAQRVADIRAELMDAEARWVGAIRAQMNEAEAQWWAAYDAAEEARQRREKNVLRIGAHEEKSE